MGHVGDRKRCEPILSAFPGWCWEIRNSAIEGELIWLRFSVTGTHRGTFQGIEATQRRVEISEFMEAVLAR